MCMSDHDSREMRFLYKTCKYVAGYMRGRSGAQGSLSTFFPN